MKNNIKTLNDSVAKENTQKDDSERISFLSHISRSISKVRYSFLYSEYCHRNIPPATMSRAQNEKPKRKYFILEAIFFRD